MSKIGKFLILSSVCFALNTTDNIAMDGAKKAYNPSCWNNVKCALYFSGLTFILGGITLGWTIVNRHYCQ